MENNIELNTPEKYLDLSERRNETSDDLNKIYDNGNVPRETSVEENENVSRETSVEENENVSRETLLEYENQKQNYYLDQLANFIRNSELDAEKEKQKAKLEKELNLPYIISQEELPHLEKVLTAKNFKTLKEGTQEFVLADPRLSALVFTDIPNVKNSETFFDWLKLASMDIFKAGRAGYLQTAELVNLQTNYAITKEMTPENVARAKQIIAYQEEIHNAKTWLGRATSEFVHLAGTLAGMIPEALETGIAGATVGAAAGSLAGGLGAVAGATLGLTIGISASIAKQIFFGELGSSFDLLKSLNVDDNTAQLVSGGVAVANTAIGMLSFKLASSAILKPIITNLTKRYAEKVAITSAWGRGVDLVRHTAMYTAGETGINLMQGTVQHLGQELSVLSITDQKQLEKIKDRGTYAQMLQNTAEYSIKATMGFGLIGGGFRYRNQVAYVNSILTQAKLRAEEIQRAGESKVRERDVKAHTTLLNHLSEGQNTGTYYISANKLQEVFEKLGVTEQDIQENLTKVAEQLKDALGVENIGIEVTDTDIKISVGEFFSLPTEVSSALNEHLRNERDTLSAYEAQEFNASEGLQQAEDADATQRQNIKESKLVKTQIYSAIKKTGLYDVKTNEALATMMHTFYEVLSKELGVLIYDLYEETAPTVVSRFQEYMSGTTETSRGIQHSPGVLGTYSPGLNRIFVETNMPVDVFIHETAHFFFQTLVNIAKHEDASPRVKEHVEKYIGLFYVEGMEDLANIEPSKWVDMHENFAYSFTKYLLDGKAPTPELAPLYRTLSRYMTALHRTFDNLNQQFQAQMGEPIINYSPELVQIMDRVLASQDAIDAVHENGYIYSIFGSAEEAGVSPEQWQAYEALAKEAKDRSVEILTAKSLEAMQWLSEAQNKQVRKLQAKNRKLRAKIKKEVTEEVKNHPIYSMLDKFKENKDLAISSYKIREILELSYSPHYNESFAYLNKAMQRLRYHGIAHKYGGAVNTTIQLFGYTSPEKFFYDILTAEPKAEYIRRTTDNRMLEHQDNIKTQEQIDNIVNEAIHNKARSRFIATELSWLKKDVNKPARVYEAYAKQIAIAKIGKMKLSDINATKFGKMANRYSILADSARARGKMEDAIEHKTMELLYNEMVKQAIEIENEKARFQHLLRRYKLGDKAIVSLGHGRDLNRVNEGRVILALIGEYDPTKYGFASKDAFLNIMDTRHKSMIGQQFIDSVKIMLAEHAGEFSEFTTDQYIGVLHAISGLWQLAKRERQVRLGAKKESLAAFRKKLTETLILTNQTSRNFTRKVRPEKEVKRNKLIKAGYDIARPEHVLAFLDPYDTEGGFFTQIFRRVKEVANNYRLAREQHTKQIADAFKALPKYKGTIDGSLLKPGLVIKSKADVIGIILHMGNDSNMQRLLKGYDWGEIDEHSGRASKRNLMAFFNQLIEKEIITKADMDFVQLSWDIINQVKARTQVAHYEMTGFYFTEISPTPIQTRWGEYRGGYVPLTPSEASIKQPTRSKSAEASLNEVFQNLEGDFVGDMPQNFIYRGFTRERSFSEYALSLNIEQLVSRHIDKALKYSEILPTLKDIMKVIDDPEFRHILEVTNPGMYEGVLIPWITNTAKQNVLERGNAVVDAVARYLNRNATLFYLTGNVKNIAQQFTGATVGFHDVQSKFLKGALNIIKQDGYASVYQKVIEKSGEMYDRMENGFRLYSDLIKGTIDEFEGHRITNENGDINPLILQHMTQSMVDTYLWIAKYSETLDRAINHVTDEDANVLSQMSATEIEKEAIDRADALVRKSQDSYGAEDKAPFQRGTPGYQSFIKFSSYLNSTNNYTFFRVMQARRDLSGSAKYKAIMQAIAYMYIIPSVIDKTVEVALNKHFSLNDDESYADVFLETVTGGVGDYLKGAIPLYNLIGDPLFRRIFGSGSENYNARVGGSPAVRILEDGADALHDLIQRMLGEKEGALGRREARDYSVFLSLLFTRRAGEIGFASRPISYEVGRQKGEVEAKTLLDGALGYITGKPREESKKK